jgi:hypothetical protein
MDTSRHISIRPDNIPSDGKISFKNGFPVLSFTIQAQNGLLDPRTIRINGGLKIFKDNIDPPTPVYTDDANQITLDNRLGVFSLWDQLIIRHGRSKQICEHIRHYNTFLNSYLGTTSSKNDLLGYMSQSALMQPNEEAMFHNVVATGTAANANDFARSFSCHLPCGFINSGNMINLMPSSFGSVVIEIHLSPDSNCLYSRNGVTTGVEDAHYELSDLSLTCEINDISPDDQVTFAQQTEGAYEFQTITSLYTSINTGNAQIQYSLGMSKLQSVFMTFKPAANINTLTQNGLASTYPSNTTGNALASFTRIQFLRGGQKYPEDFDTVGVTTDAANVNSATESFVVADAKMALDFAESIMPEHSMVRTTLSPLTLNRDYTMDDTGNGGYKAQPGGGPLFGIGMRYSQFNQGQNFRDQQWGVSLESTLNENNPIGVFIFYKNKTTVAWNPNGVQIST